MKKWMNKKLAIEMAWAFVGVTLFSLGVNILITPLGLYNGGFMGMSQLIRTGLVQGLGLDFLGRVDIAGIIYYLINIPIFIWAWKEMGKKFLVTSLIIVTVQTLWMTFVPIPKEPIISDYLTACIIGGLVVGTGVGMVLRGRTSGGGQDIVGVIFAKKYPNFSVGKITIMMNAVIYAVCLWMFDIETVVYSLIYTTVLAMACDRMHVQNINISAMIFTKKEGIAAAVMSEMGRGVTTWEGVGAYTNETSHILYIMISKYEVEQLKEIIHRVDPHAFIIFNEGSSVVGNFEKRL
ncbi:MAG: YitT family protein [Tyzzerella sp.]|nr:YitT family protein [Tyzzerella sp.]